MYIDLFLNGLIYLNAASCAGAKHVDRVRFENHNFRLHHLKEYFESLLCLSANCQLMGNCYEMKGRNVRSHIKTLRLFAVRIQLNNETLIDIKS